MPGSARVNTPRTGCLAPRNLPPHATQSSVQRYQRFCATAINMSSFYNYRASIAPTRRQEPTRVLFYFFYPVIEA